MTPTFDIDRAGIVDLLQTALIGCIIRDGGVSAIAGEHLTAEQQRNVIGIAADIEQRIRDGHSLLSAVLLEANALGLAPEVAADDARCH
jgi:hypothetical protein